MQLSIHFASVTVLAVFLAAIRLAPGDEPATEKDPNIAPTIELAIAAAAEPRPALKYRLAPDIGERKAGNAASHYYRAIILQRQKPKEYWQQAEENYAAWNEGPA